MKRYKKRPYEREYAKGRRAQLRALKLCINGPLPGARTYFARSSATHGPVKHSGKCDRCLAVWRATHERKEAA